MMIIIIISLLSILSFVYLLFKLGLIDFYEFFAEEERRSKLKYPSIDLAYFYGTNRFLFIERVNVKEPNEYTRIIVCSKEQESEYIYYISREEHEKLIREYSRLKKCN